VYRRVFLTREHAELWARGWNDARGDPAQPFHYAAMVEGTQREVGAPNGGRRAAGVGGGASHPCLLPVAPLWPAPRAEPAPTTSPQILALERAGRHLDAQKLLATAACALGDADLLFHASRAAHSAAQELRCLQARSRGRGGRQGLGASLNGSRPGTHGRRPFLTLPPPHPTPLPFPAQQHMNASLVALMSPAAHPEARAKLDAERARRMFLLYCGRLRRAFAAPRCCLFSGFAAVGPHVIGRLKQQAGGGAARARRRLRLPCRERTGPWLVPEPSQSFVCCFTSHATPGAQVLGSFRLCPEGLQLMGQLQLWTRCCEVSVAACVVDCVDARLRHGLAARCCCGGGGLEGAAGPGAEGW
jgi:hypothetical protein